MADFDVTKEKMDEGNFYVKNGVVRRVNDETARVEVRCRFRQTTGAMLLNGT